MVEIKRVFIFLIVEVMLMWQKIGFQSTGISMSYRKKDTPPSAVELKKKGGVRCR